MASKIDLSAELKQEHSKGTFTTIYQTSGEVGFESTLSSLTHRQQQVIRSLSRGYSNKVIARELGISPDTVKVHVHAFRSWGVHSRRAAAAALRQAWRSTSSSARPFWRMSDGQGRPKAQPKSPHMRCGIDLFDRSA